MSLLNTFEIGVKKVALNRVRRAVGTFRTKQEAERALEELRDSGFNMERVSVIAKNADHGDRIAGKEVEERHVGNKADEGAAKGAATGGAIGGITGLLVGLGLLAIPGIGPIMLAGAGATALATTLSGAAIGAATGGLLGALIGLGIPEARAKVYHDRVARGEYLVMVEGTDDELHRAETLLHRRGIEEWGIYDMPDGTAHSAVVEAPGATGAVHPVVDTTRTAAVGSSPVVEPAARADRTRGTSIGDEEAIRLHEERLVVDKHRQKTGEVAVNKRIKTEQANVSVPVEKERVIVERVDSAEIGRPVSAAETSFQDGEAIRVELYEETADIRKEAFVREEVTLRKEVEQQVVDANETLRREKLDVQRQGNPIVDTNE